MKADKPLQPANPLSQSSTKNTIKQWSEEDRPREKLLRLGARNLSDAELLAIFINSGTEQDTALDLAKKLMTGLDNDLGRLLEIDHAYLTGSIPGEKKKRFVGLGDARACTILAAIELGRRLRDTPPPLRTPITCSLDAYRVLRRQLESLDHEELRCLYLDASGRVIDKLAIASGGVSHAVADLRLILAPAITLYASAIILAHNHPTGHLQPSAEDIDLTKRVKQVASVCNIRLNDHLILGRYHASVTSDGERSHYLSFADSGMLASL